MTERETVAGGKNSAPTGEQVVAFLRERNCEAWLVGGFVRDGLLDVGSHDVDVIVRTGGARCARAVSEALGGAWFVLDEARDVGRAILGRDTASPLCVDVARLRAPELVDDLALRDFTINAMAQDLGPTEKVIDPFGGQADLASRSVRAVSEGAFVDDPLRILRGLRLAAEMGFCIEDATLTLMRRDASLLESVATERVRDELDRILCSKDAWMHLETMSRLGVLRHVLPECDSQIGVTQSAPHYLDVFDHTRSVIAHLEGLLALLSPGEWAHPVAATGDPVRIAASHLWEATSLLLAGFAESLTGHLRGVIGSSRSHGSMLMWAALMHDWGKPEARSADGDAVHFFGHEEIGVRLAVRRGEALHFSVPELRFLKVVVGLHMRIPLLVLEAHPSDRALYRFCRVAGDYVPDLVLLALADRLSTQVVAQDADEWDRTIQVCRRLLQRFFNDRGGGAIPAPMLDGSRIMSLLGIPAGPRVGKLIEGLREAQAVGEVTTESDAQRWLLAASERNEV